MKAIFNKMVIDKTIAIPLYYQLKMYIEKAIKNGVLVEGDLLPSEEEIAKAIDVSRPTVRQALKELDSEGYLDRQRAKGTFITKPQVYGNYLSKLESFYHEMVNQGKTPVTKVISMKVIENDERLSELLNCKQSIYLERVRYADNVPVVYIESYIPYETYQDVLNEDMEQTSLYDKMKALNYPVVKAKRLIQATAANAREAEYLEVKKNTALLYIVTTGFSADEERIEYSIARYKGNSNKFEIELTV